MSYTPSPANFLISTKLESMLLEWLNSRGKYFGKHKLTPSSSSVKKESISESKDVGVWVDKYLGMGEWVLDSSVAFAGSSRFFERKR